MTQNTLKKPLREDGPGDRQSAAADPLRSVWVGASAGTGKTKVLIDRVLRLMLPRSNGLPATRPEKILCLTFTKTAAAEMSNRIYDRLAKWAVRDDAALEKEIAELIGEKPTPEILQDARRIFARVLDTPGGLKIMTIHSFCQSVLKRFPVEAGLPPHFQLMDEQSAVEYLTRCLHDIIAKAKSGAASPLAASFSLLAQYLDSAAMSELMAKIMAKRNVLSSIFARHGDAEGLAEKTVAEVYACLGLSLAETEEGIKAAAGNIPPEAEAALRTALRALIDGKATDVKRAGFMQPWLEQKEKRGSLLHDYRSAFFTQQGKIVDRFATNDVVAACPGIIETMAREAERLQAVEERLKAVRLAEINAALLTVAAEMTGRYARYKRQTDRLDFDDLIIKTCDLLSEKDMVSWVLYKLDEGIDHILVDEAQDTSPSQWRVIRSLTGEFFAGTGTRGDLARTLFVVGDEKQSIFSFQGADPSEFARMQAYFGGKVAQVQEGWEILLEHSFRSTRTVLDLVDNVFADETVKKGVVADRARAIRHLAFRSGQAGLVELWPLVKARAKPEMEPWKIPVEIEEGDSAGVRLAKKMAATVRKWIDAKEILPSKGRPIRAGDVLILVQSRGAFVEQIMRALKEYDVPVAGIDRLTLSEEIAVMDLLAVAHFALQPRDDLTLATILKSPLFGLDDDDLFTLCHGRKETLWAVLQKERGDIAAHLMPYVSRAGKATPYEFFADILNMPCFADPVSGRRAFYGRLGFDIHDALDEFLNSCLHYEQSHTPSLQKFADWFTRGDAEIKREQEQHKADQVRIMTVHGSKGLQAPIVFLPDTVKKNYDHNKGRARLLWPSENGDDEMTVPLWSPRMDFDAEFYAVRQEAAVDRQDEEYRRLFYVALTRAEDRLYICGHHGVKGPKEDCWYSLAEKAFPATAEKEFFMKDEEGNDLFLRRLHHPQEVVPKAPERVAASDDIRVPMPPWVLKEPVAEPAPTRPLSPSKPGEDEPAVKSPLGTDAQWKFRRGVIVHQILEILPQLPEAQRATALAAYLSRPVLGMTPDVQARFAEEVMNILHDKSFAPIFGAGSRAEVPVVGVAGAKGKTISGQIDRLLVTADEILVVDYKTNRPPPDKAEDVMPVYLKQMAAYKALLQKIYPDRAVRCALLWTDAPRLMPLSEKLLDPHMP